jgi:hypothetical protein
MRPALDAEDWPKSLPVARGASSWIALNGFERFSIYIRPNSDTANLFKGFDLCMRMRDWFVRRSTRSGLEMDFALEKIRKFNAINRAITRFARSQTRTEAGISLIGKH